MKVLDAPALKDDFYLKLIDWSQKDELAVGLDNNLYLWNAQTTHVERLCEYSRTTITSVSWSKKGDLLAVGTSKGDVSIWDPEKMREIMCVKGHESRVGSMDWK